MASLIRGETTVSLEFTAFEVDLMREIAFNLNCSLEDVAAGHLSRGILVEKPGEDKDYEFKYSGNTTLEIIEEPDGEDKLREKLAQTLTELYNVAWTSGHTSKTPVMDVEARKLLVAIRVDMIIHDVVNEDA